MYPKTVCCNLPQKSNSGVQNITLKTIVEENYSIGDLRETILNIYLISTTFKSMFMFILALPTSFIVDFLACCSRHKIIHSQSERKIKGKHTTVNDMKQPREMNTRVSLIFVQKGNIIVGQVPDFLLTRTIQRCFVFFTTSRKQRQTEDGSTKSRENEHSRMKSQQIY